MSFSHSEDDLRRLAREREKKQSHSESEQRRRQAINQAIEELRLRVEAHPFDSKATVLANVIKHFQSLENEVSTLREANDRLRNDNNRLKIKLGDSPGAEGSSLFSSGSMLPPISPRFSMEARRSLPHINELSLGNTQRGSTDLPPPITAGARTISYSAFTASAPSFGPIVGPSSSSMRSYRFPAPPQIKRQRSEEELEVFTRRGSASSDNRGYY